MNYKKYKYVEVKKLSNMPQMTVGNIGSFIKLIEAANTDLILQSIITEDTVTKTDFIVLYKEMIFLLDANNYKCVEDYAEAADGEFPTAAEYYEAKKGNYHSYKEYVECMKAGSTDKEKYIQASKYGYVDNYDKFVKALETHTTALPPSFNSEKINSAIKLYEYASSNGFRNFKEFTDIFFLGFDSPKIYNEAKQNGFSYADEYFDAIKLGFTKIQEYQEARHLKIKSKFEYQIYSTLKQLSKGIYSFDQVDLMQRLKKAENGKRFAVDTLKEMRDEEVQKRYFNVNDKGAKCLPEWYSVKLLTTKDIKEFMFANEELKEFGIYYKDIFVYEVSRLSTSIIYIDGSNVAFNSNERTEKNKPRLFNLILMAQKMQSLRFKEINVISDASLRHKIIDINTLDKLKQMVNYLEAPANTSADEFIIEQAKKNKSYIISNDTFTDWKLKDAWIAENIDKIRIPFMIIETTVSVPALERIVTL